MRSATRELLVAAAAVLLFVVVLSLQPRLVGGLPGAYKRDTKHCNGKGMINSDGTCNCYSGYKGGNCTLRYCPFGKSWATMPSADHVRNRPNVECSDMGACNLRTGLCACRDGFEGRACERMSCPSAVKGQVCSGRGRCLTMRDASNEFNGYSLVRPPVDYNGWDADSIQGCVCDYGYEGYDCSRRSCPYGVDPLSSVTPVLEKMTLACNAVLGNFNIQILGYTTPAINANFGPAALKYVLESIPGMGTVTVEMSTFSASGEARVCGYNYLSTTYITLNNYVGINPPRMRLITGKTVNSRLNAAGELPIVGESLTLYMQTTYTLTCPACAGCNAGVIWFSMGDSISDEILLIAEYDSVSTAISRAIRNLEDLKRGNWENLEVVVTASSDDSRICLNGQSNLFTVNVRSNYGNLPKIDMIGSAWKGERNEVALTWISVIFQEGTPLPCSGQGFCNYTAGRCECSRFYDQNKIQFEMISSDGAGNAGNRGDCGHYKRTRSSLLGAACTSTTNSTNGGKTLCSGHGECLSMLSDACSCYTGWSGILCNIATTCPSGPAWFDEAISSTVAHQPAVCSNMGLCNRKSGRCACRKGYYGAACQYKDCPRNESGVACNGQGWCMSMHKWAEIAGFEYGDEQNALVAPAAWDAFGFHACMCSAGHPSPYSRSGRSNTMRPEVGPMSMIDGWPAQTPKLPGWRGYSCQERNCPSGNRIVSPSTDSSATAVFEEQIVGCIGGNTSNVSFTLSFYDHNTATITGEMGPSEIKAAIEWAPTIGNVSISFLDGTLQTACSRFNSAFDGFVVRFDTELGNIPLLQLVDSKNAMVNISQRVAGTLTDEECGGIQSGVCNRTTGTCQCHGRFRSSGGMNNLGTRGDCGFYYQGVVDLDYI